MVGTLFSMVRLKGAVNGDFYHSYEHVCQKRVTNQWRESHGVNVILWNRSGPTMGAYV